VSAPESTARLLSGASVRDLAERVGVRPTKRWGQNFVVDPNTVRRIVRLAEVEHGTCVLEVGPGLGSLTLGLLEAGAEVVAVEIDPALADALPATVAERAPDLASQLTVLAEDALRLTTLPRAPTAFVANLPYNVAVPVLLHLLATFPSLEHGLVMVQSEVAERLAAPPGSRVYGVPSVKAAWYADVQQAGRVPRSVFWPVPNVDSGLVSFRRRPVPESAVGRDAVFECVDAAFSQRRKSLRSALARWAGSAQAAEDALRAAGVDPSERGERLDVTAFTAVAEQRPAVSP
jgi:16S rRNA (adenine1518-N6/adenine1519-N6)-dimethyltransferase